MLFFALGTLIGLPVWVGASLALLFFERTLTSLWREERVAFFFSMGLALWSWLVWLGYQIQSSLMLVGVAYGLLGLVGWGIVFWRKGGTAFRYLWDGQGEKRLWGIALLWGVAYFLVGAYQDPSADSFRHLAFIRRLVERGVLSDKIYVLSPHEPQDLLNGAYARNAIHAWYGWVAHTFGVDPAQLWFHAPAVFIPLMFIALFALARLVTGSSRLAMRSLVLWGVVWATVGGPLRATGHPASLAGNVLYPVWVLLLFDQENLVKPGVFMGLAGLTSALFLIHSQWWMFALLTLGIRGVQLGLQRETRTLWVLVGLGLISSALSLPFLFSRLPFYRPIASELKEVLAYRYRAQMYSVGPLQGFLPRFVFSSWWYGLFGVAAGMLWWKRRWYPCETLRFAAVMVGSVLGMMLTPFAGIIAVVATTTIAARLRILVLLWGLPLFVAVLFVKRSNPWLVLARRMVGGGIGGWLVYRLVIWPVVKMGALRNVALLEKLLLELATWLHLPLMTLKTGLKSMLPWITFGLMLGVLGVLVVLGYHWRQRLSLWKEFLLRQETKLVVVLWGVLFIAPGSQIAPWHAMYLDRIYARLYGPTLSQTLRSTTLIRLLNQIPSEAYVLSDNPNWIVAFRDVYVVNSVQGELRAGREINAHFAPVFVFDIPIQDVLALLREVPYPPEYLLLTPYRSDLAWMKYDRYPEVFEKVFDEVAPETTYFNRRFVLYRLHLGQKVNLAENEKPFTEDMLLPATETCAQRLYPFYRSVPPPDGGGRQGNELYDGDDHALLWIMLRPAWFYVEFSFATSPVYVHQVKISSRRFASSCHLEEVALFVQQGSQYVPIEYKQLPAPLSSPDMKLVLPVNRFLSKWRLAFYAKGPVYLDEVEVVGCVR